MSIFLGMKPRVKSHITPRTARRKKFWLGNAAKTSPVAPKVDIPKLPLLEEDKTYYFVKNADGTYLSANTHSSMYYSSSSPSPSPSPSTPARNPTPILLPDVSWVNQPVYYEERDIDTLREVLRHLTGATANLRSVRLVVQDFGPILSEEDNMVAARNWIATEIDPHVVRALGLEVERSVFELSENPPIYYARTKAMGLTPLREFNL